MLTYRHTGKQKFNFMSKDIQKTALRLPRELHSAIHQAANESGRTMNAEIVYRLQKSLDDECDARGKGIENSSIDDTQQPTYNELKEAFIAMAKSNVFEKLDNKINELDKSLENMSIKLNKYNDLLKK